MPEPEPDEQPMNAVEALAGMISMGPLIAAFHSGLKEAGFDEGDALNLNRAYVHGMAGGKLA